MITLYHSPQSRSTSVVSLLRLMRKENDIAIDIVHIKRRGDAGHADPHNPHPDKKVPILDVDGHLIRERAAIMLWLTDHFDSPLGRGVESPVRGAFLSWLFYYGNVVEPVFYTTALELAENQMVHEWCRGVPDMIAALETALSDHDYLVDDQISAADILVASPFRLFPQIIPESGPVPGWLARCEAAQDGAFLAEFEAKAMETLGLPVPESGST